MTSTTPSASRTRQLRFLVVDDYEDIRDVFCRFIERAGHVATTACDGQEAVEILERESFDLMLLDFTMPRMDGADVVRWLKAHPDVAPTMRVVVVTAWAVNNRAIMADLGVETVLEKPLSMQRLTDLIVRTQKEIDASLPAA